MDANDPYVAAWLAACSEPEIAPQVGDPDKDDWLADPRFADYIAGLRKHFVPRNGLDDANLSCLLKRREGEPLFIILGRDPDGGFIVRAWAVRRQNAGGAPEHVFPVYAIADAMDAYAADPANAPASAPPKSAYPQDGISADVRRLVIAARLACAAAHIATVEIDGLDKAAEAFASRVPWDDEPEPGA